VPSFGPGLLTAAHAPNESISLDSLVEAAKIYALAALRYLDA
jgi:acetylornithine deacetylase/succinyl-diaminopimelate desuccinylase-like protein